MTITRTFLVETDLEFTWHNEFWSINSYKHINSAEDEDGQDDGKVTDEFPHLGESEHKHVLYTDVETVGHLIHIVNKNK